MEGVAGPKLISADEQVVLRTRTHAKVLIGPSLLLIIIAGAAGAGAALVPSGYRPWGHYVVLGLGLLIALRWVVVPFLRWRRTTYTITTHRLIMRSGILRRVGKDLPLVRVNDVSSDRGLIDRLLGCGTLYLQTAADSGTIVLSDVPEVEEVQLAISELLLGAQPPGAERA